MSSRVPRAGIGRAVSVAFAREGATVVGADICAPVNPTFGVKPASPEDLTATGQAVVAAGGRWQGHIVDQRDIFQLRELAQKVVSSWGGVDILFANAGVQGFAPLATMDDGHWRDQIEVNLTGTANALRVFAPLLIARGGGRIIITSSTQGRHGTLHGAAYSASKWGLIGLMKSAALDLGEYGVTVNAVIPGLIDTELTRHEERYAQAIEVSGRAPSGKAGARRSDSKGGSDPKIAAARALDRTGICGACRALSGVAGGAHGLWRDLRRDGWRQRQL